MSEFWYRKMKRFFEVMDVFKKGFLTRDDHMLFGERLSKNVNVKPEHGEELRRSLSKIWCIYTKSVGSGDDVLLTEEILAESFKAQRNDTSVRAALFELLLCLLTAFDENRDGFLQPGEHYKFFQSVGVNDVDKFAKIAFDAIDTNHDGKLSKEEMSAAFSHFVTSEDETSPYQYFFGPV